MTGETAKATGPSSTGPDITTGDSAVPDADGSLTELVTFHLTGRLSGRSLMDIADLDLRPALFAGLEDMAALRHDYPLILVNEGTSGGPVRTLSSFFDEFLRGAVPEGIEGERTRSKMFKLEEQIRSLSASESGKPLGKIWNRAAKKVLEATDKAERRELKDDFARAREHFAADGTLLGCNAESPVALLRHLWRAVESDKAEEFQREVGALAAKLADILEVDFVKSDKGRSAKNLKSAVGTPFEQVFDFQVMSRLLKDSTPKNPLPAKRRQRIESALSTLRSQRFIKLEDGGAAAEAENNLFTFEFKTLGTALAAFRGRLSELTELVKAIAVAELEIDNRYREVKHDPFFEAFDETSLGPRDMARFPCYLADLGNSKAGGKEEADLTEILASDLPIKILVRDDDLLGAPSTKAATFSFGVESLNLANMAMGLCGAYVLQSAASNLYQARDDITSGMAYQGPTLFNVFTGGGVAGAGISPYLMGAAAMQSRAFPAFTFNPAAGSDWASRFRIADNPQPTNCWTAHEFHYEDQAHQRMTEDICFTFVDFVACDQRYAEHFAKVPRDRWHQDMVPANIYLESVAHRLAGEVPYILMIDRENVLHRVIIDERIIRAARRYGQVWHSLQELGGIENSHARALLAKEREALEQEKIQVRRDAERSTQADAPTPPVAADQMASDGVLAEAADEEEPRSPDEAYIETARCTACNECFEINNRMFAYDENQQAYFADLDAGTFKELVESAESCQVSIIHPGKPRYPDEPDVESLIERAAAFN